MIRDDSVYLRHIFDAIQKSEDYAKGLDLSSFLENDLVQDACIRQLLVIGEAAKGLSSQCRNTYAHVPWADVAGMRDKLVHQYFGIDLEKIWMTIKEDLPILKQEIERILQHS
jgi:uncharacterized protein with HEPN domain